MESSKPDESANKSAYKVEPDLKKAKEVIDECRDVAEKVTIQPLGEIDCPIPSEAE